MAIQKNLLADRKVADFRKQGTVYLLVPGAIILSLCTMSPHHSQQCEQQATQGVALISLLSFVKNMNYGTFSLKHHPRVTDALKLSPVAECGPP